MHDVLGPEDEVDLFVVGDELGGAHVALEHAPVLAGVGPGVLGSAALDDDDVDRARRVDARGRRGSPRNTARTSAAIAGPRDAAPGPPHRARRTAMNDRDEDEERRPEESSGDGPRGVDGRHGEGRDRHAAERDVPADQLGEDDGRGEDERSPRSVGRRRPAGQRDEDA